MTQVVTSITVIQVSDNLPAPFSDTAMFIKNNIINRATKLANSKQPFISA